MGTELLQRDYFVRARKLFLIFCSHAWSSSDAFSYSIRAADGRRSVGLIQPRELEVVPSQDDVGEGLVVQEHVHAARVRQLAGVVGLVLQATGRRVLEPGQTYNEGIIP